MFTVILIVLVIAIAVCACIASLRAAAGDLRGAVQTRECYDSRRPTL